MDKEKRKKVEYLKLEADRYVHQRGWKSCENRPRLIGGFGTRLFRNMPLSSRYGLAAILISYPGLIPIIAFGGANPLPQNLAIGCIALVSMSMPLFLLAGRAEQVER